jgi:Fe-S cluster assembly iron-binding protein IscA
MDEQRDHENILPGGAMPPKPVISLTEKAVEMVKVAMRREQLIKHGLRVSVLSGGCGSSFSA